MGKLPLYFILLAIISCSKTSENKQKDKLEIQKTNIDSLDISGKSKKVVVTTEKSSVPKIKESTTPEVSPKITEKRKIERTASPIKKVRRAKVSTSTLKDKVQTKTSAPMLKSQTSLVVKDKSNNKEKLNSTLILTGETDFKETQQKDKYYGSSVSLNIGYQLTDDYKLGLTLAFDKDLSSGFEEKGKDSSLSVSYRPLIVSDRIKFVPSASALYPTSKESKVRDEMITALSLSPTFITQLTDNLNFVFIPRMQRKFHKYTTNRVNKTNSEYVYQNITSLSYSFTDKLSLTPSFIYSKKWSYSGRQKTDVYVFSAETNYQLTDNSELTLGYANSGPIYNTEKGPDKTIEILDENKSSIYTSVGVMF